MGGASTNRQRLTGDGNSFHRLIAGTKQINSAIFAKLCFAVCEDGEELFILEYRIVYKMVMMIVVMMMSVKMKSC